MGPDPDFEVVDELERFVTHAHAGASVFLTGQAGTGKSTVLRRYIREGQARGRKLAVTASTGIAALNLEGSTVYRWCGMQLGVEAEETNEQTAERIERDPRGLSRAKRRVRDAEVLILDEVSMFPGRQLDFLNYWMQYIREDPRPFGGLQVILCGDFCQLPPVRKNENAPYDWAFNSEVWRSGFLQKSISLERIRRQNDREFTHALGRVRVGDLRGRASELLRGQVLENPENERPRLLTHNAQVDKWCDYQLGKLEDMERAFEAVATGSPAEIEGLTRHVLAPASLVLKIGARVMNLVNRDLPDDRDVPHFVANGQLGIVRKYGRKCVTTWEDGRPREESAEVVWVDFDGFDSPVAVFRFTWKWRHLENPTFTQFPLRLAYAMTIHKCQGLTLDEAHLDVRAAREPGQAYVAFSRVRSLSGLSLKEFPRGLYVADEAIAFHERIDRAPGYFEPAPIPKGAPVIVSNKESLLRDLAKVAEKVAEQEAPPEVDQEEIPFDYAKPAAPAEGAGDERPYWKSGRPNYTGD
jgi:ATP-dependent exoDNAse (exonuclease V) alpha subunit